MKFGGKGINLGNIILNEVTWIQIYKCCCTFSLLFADLRSESLHVGEYITFSNHRNQESRKGPLWGALERRV